MDIKNINTLGELKQSGYQTKTIKEELRDNLITKLQKGEQVFEGIIGYQHTVIPEIERAILSNHNMLLLGLRGQAKTRIARLLVNLLDEHIPYIQGTELLDDPFNPISNDGLSKIKELGDNTPIAWLHRSKRYVEKLATPDVSVADLIGDVDPIKAASLKLPYSDPRVIHYGLIPRANRSLFVINELPDLQARIQVSLFNILQEGDIQIRGFKMALPLDIQFLFTANPEDYTNRGSIITPLKDRIESQILTHYPESLEEAIRITQQEANIDKAQSDSIEMPSMMKELVEMVGFEARYSDLVDEQSGVSARLTISAMENLYAAVYRRMLINKEKKSSVRISDIGALIPSITGKVELVYEGEQMGSYEVAQSFLGNAVKSLFTNMFPNPDKLKDQEKDPYGTIKAWFSAGNTLDLYNDTSDKDFKAIMDDVAGLRTLAESYLNEDNEIYLLMELILHGLSEFNVISKDYIENGMAFNDPFTDMWNDLNN